MINLKLATATRRVSYGFQSSQNCIRKYIIMKSMFLSLERRQTCFAISCVCNLLKFSSIEGALEENIRAKVYVLVFSLLAGYHRALRTGKSQPLVTNELVELKK